MTSGSSYSPPPAFGRFRLLHQVGAGVLGPVFRTHDPDDDRLVAVKAFTLDLTPEQAEQLAEELRRLTTIDLPHAHLAAPIDAGVEESVAYLAQQYVTGESLDAAIRQYGPAPMADAARLIGHVAEALDAAARVGVFHGALHPRDILVTPGETHLTGLGIATALDRIGVRAPVRRPYAAPERESGGAWGAAADVFALAAIAHEVITGRRALPGTEEPLPGLEDLKGPDAQALREVLELALDADPERRQATAMEFATAFASALGLQAGAAASRPRRRPRAKPAPKLPGLDEPLIPAEEPKAEPDRGLDAAPVVPVPIPEPPAAVAPEPPPDLPPPAPDIEELPPTPGSLLADELREAFDALPAEEHEPPAAEPAPPAENAPAPDDEPPLALPARFEPVADRSLRPTPAGLALEDLKLRMTPPPEEIVRPAVSPDVEALSEEIARFEPPVVEPPVAPEPPPPPPPEPPARVEEPRSVDDLREPGALVSEPPVPRALDPGAAGQRPSGPSRRVEPYRPVQPRERSLAWPVGIGIVGGLVVGLGIGFWLGGRGQVPAGVGPPAPATTTAAPSPTAPPASATPPATASTAVSTPAVPAARPAAPAAAAAPAPSRAAAPPSPALSRPAASPSPATSSPPPAPPVEDDTGTIRVRSTPERADVFLDGERQGVTPRNLTDLAFGRYTIRVTRPGYAPAERVVTIDAKNREVRVPFTLKRAGRTPEPSPPPAAPRKTPPPEGAPAAQPSFALRPAVVAGAIEVETRPPGARVFLDGRDVGVSPIVLGAVTVGSHTVRFDLAGYARWTTTVTVKAGARVRVAASLERRTTR